MMYVAVTKILHTSPSSSWAREAVFQCDITEGARLDVGEFSQGRVLLPIDVYLYFTYFTSVWVWLYARRVVADTVINGA